MIDDQSDGKIRTREFKIITCSCYVSDWKKIRETEDENWKFDEIEKEKKKSFRKVFANKMILLHSCCNCFEKIIMENPFIIEANDLAGHCIMKRFLCAIGSVDDICNGCLSFFISKFENKFNIV